jgi:hypothetical protein
MSWFDWLWKQHGDNFLDDGPRPSRVRFLQGYKDADYIATARTERVEEGIDTLVSELKRLRKN